MENSTIKNNLRTPAEVSKCLLDSGVAKSKMPIFKLALLGLFAGMFIAFGASSSSLAAHSMSDLGLAKFVAGVVFPVGLMLIIIAGGALFTGDCLLIIGVADKKIKPLRLLRTLSIVFISNLIGGFIVAAGISLCGQFDMSNGLLGAYTLKVAACKVALSPTSAIISGILCNIIVCFTVVMATAATDVPGKILTIFFPILAFVLGGYEHCVANMYYIPAGLLAKLNPKYVEVAKTSLGVTADQINNLSIHTFFTNNLLPVTIGNIIGGMVFVGIPLYILYLKRSKAKH